MNEEGGRGIYGTEEEIWQYRTLASLMDTEPETILYTASSSHASVARAFPRSQVLHVDPDAEAARLMQSAGYIFFCASIPRDPVVVREELEDLFIPAEQVDMIASLRGSLSIEQEYLRNGGYILCDNIYGNVDRLISDQRFNVIGVIDTGKLVDQDLEPYVSFVSSEMELLLRDPFLYKSIQQIVSDAETLCPNLIASEQSTLLERYGAMFNLGKKVVDMSLLQKILLPRIPMKKNAELFLFRKRKPVVIAGPEL